MKIVLKFCGNFVEILTISQNTFIRIGSTCGKEIHRKNTSLEFTCKCKTKNT